MKPALALCTALFFTLTACGQAGTVAPVPTSAPQMVSPIPLSAQEMDPVPCGVSLSDLPLSLIDRSADIWGEQSLFLLAQLPEEDVSLYGLVSDDDGSIILRKGDNLTAYSLPWRTPQALLPRLCAGDFDGDGHTELLLLTYDGGGTGVSAWTLTLLEPSGHSWTALSLPSQSYSDALSPLLSCRYTQEEGAVLTCNGSDLPFDLPTYADSKLPLETYTGTIVNYTVSPSVVTVQLAVGIWQEESIPYTTEYPAQLEAQLIYDGQGGVSLTALTLVPYLT